MKSFASAACRDPQPCDEPSQKLPFNLAPRQKNEIELPPVTCTTTGFASNIFDRTNAYGKRSARNMQAVRRFSSSEALDLLAARRSREAAPQSGDRRSPTSRRGTGGCYQSSARVSALQTLEVRIPSAPPGGRREPPPLTGQCGPGLFQSRKNGASGRASGHTPFNVDAERVVVNLLGRSDDLTI